MTTAFETETAIEPTGPGRWTTTVGSSWNINDNPNGGYAQSALIKAMAAEAGDHVDPASITTHFLRPAVGDAEGDITVEVVRQGRMTTTVRAMMWQEGKERLNAIGTFCDLSASDGPESADQQARLDLASPPIPAPEDCLDRGNIIQGVTLPLLDRVEVRVDPESVLAELTDPENSNPDGDDSSGLPASALARDPHQPAVVSGWMRFVDGRQPDTASLPLLADCFPPSVFSVFGRIGWVPTIELTVHVRRRPVPGWIKAQFTTADLTGGLLLEDGVLWDESGAVVAQSRQLAMLR